MNEQVTVGGGSDLRALLANPPLAAALPVRRITARTVRLWVAAADAVQLVALAALTSALFPETAAVFGASGTLGFGALAAVLAGALRLQRNRGFEPAGMAASRGVAATGTAVAATGLAAWLALSQTAAPPGDLLGWVAAWLVASAGTAAALRYGAARMARALAGGQRAVVVGAPEQCEQLVRSAADAPRASWRLSGCIDDREEGALDRLVAMVEGGRADVVALAITGPDAAARTAAVCRRIADQPVRVCLALDATALTHVPRALICVGRFALVDLVTDPHGGLGGVAKRVVDLLVGGAALLALAPVLAMVGLAIRLESPGPALFRQWRFGVGSRPILVFKFRTMRSDGGDATGERRTVARDPRVTPIGRILRRTSIDELPQLLNVLRGDMSLVGPRPHPLHMRVGGEYYFEAVERYRARHLVKPGITGWAQVNGSRGEVDTMEKARRRVVLDLWYLNNWSLGLDLRILLRTVLGGFATLRAD